MPDEKSLPELPHLELADVEAIVDLLAQASDPTLNLTPNEIKHLLAQGLARLTNADTYFWNIGVLDGDLPGDSIATSYIDGGWTDDAERNGFIHAMTHSEIAIEVGKKIATESQNGKSCTVIRQERYSDEEWPTIPNEFRDLGLAEYLLSVVPLGSISFSCIGLHRRLGKPPFSVRDRAVVHVVFTNAGWIHNQGLSIESGKVAIRLTPREREVLLHLLRGDSQKMIAAKLEISVYTVGDYMKQIYKQFEVKSRGELLGRFIAPDALKY